MVRPVKKETASGIGRTTRSSAGNVNESHGTTSSSTVEDGAGERRVLRSKYLSFKNRISDEKEDISKVDSEKFKSMIEEVDNLHQLVQKPREQVADAEALFDITTSLVSSVKACRNEGVTPSDFISCLLRDFGQQSGASSSHTEGGGMVRWKDIGQVVSDAFRDAPGCRTMIGPMNTELKHRKNVAQRKRSRPAEDTHPEELDETVNKEKTDTDKNMATMFNILRRNRKVKLENLILNRNSFAQTVENLFALSFLVKDGRAEISVDDTRCHLVSPKNAPAASAILSGETAYCHFLFRFDFKDWKLMLDSTVAGEELMPNRAEVDETNMGGGGAQASRAEGEAAMPTTPIRKLCRNRGLVSQERSVVEDSPENENVSSGGRAIRKGKRRVR
ncbi:non-structural maintenance of chromosomes element 4 homolog A-like [Andrographis paniculata]|uniref:non-structural maintenance of chromosomes element 4 homolog A-like n=1 Tax=Andrographis paniculata TaxID=175694 RepID=UPI0021E723A0|nr:non-structural maintenance of chromosomes element 4 homolog A-like [Andrographis paniculata]